jgi:Transposase DDE domain group 1
MSDYVGLGLIEMAGETLADARTGRNGRHALVGLLRQSVFGRLAGYEDVNDAERLRHDPTMRCGLSAGQRLTVTQHRRARWGRFETQWLAAPAPELLVAIRTSRQSCSKAGKARIFTLVWEAFGESRLKRARRNSLREPVTNVIGAQQRQLL